MHTSDELVQWAPSPVTIVAEAESVSVETWWPVVSFSVPKKDVKIQLGSKPVKGEKKLRKGVCPW